MKTFILIRSIFSRMKSAMVIVLLVMTASLLFLTIMVGQIRYIFYAKQIFEESNYKNSIYVMVDDSHVYTSKNPDNEIENIIAEIEKFSSVKSVCRDWSIGPLWLGDKGASLHLFSEKMLLCFPFQIYPSDAVSQVLKPDSNTIPVILAGTNVIPTRVGEVITFEIKKGTEHTNVDLKIVGIVKYPVIIPSFNSAGSIVTADFFIQDGVSLITADTQDSLNFFKEKSFPVLQNNFIVNFNNEPGRDECIAAISEYATYADYDEIIRNTNAQIDEKLRTELPFPLMVVFFATMSLLSTVILTVHKKMHILSVYYLCGCGKKAISKIMIMSMGVLVSGALLLNAIFILSMPILRHLHIFRPQYMIIDNVSLVYIIIYSLVVLIIIFATVMMMFRKETPVSAKRRFEK